MLALELIHAIESAGGKVWVDGEQIGYRLPQSVLPLKDDLRAHKQEVLAILREGHIRVAPEAPLESYEAGFDGWANARCVFRDRCFGGIGALHADYAEWCLRTGQDVPCQRSTFEELLKDQGFSLCDGLVYGLILKEDLRPLAARPARANA